MDYPAVADQRGASFFSVHFRSGLAIKQQPILINAIAHADFIELVVNLVLKEGIRIWIIFLIKYTLFRLGCLFGSLFDDFLSDFELRDVAASACKLVWVASLSFGLFAVVVSLEHLIV